MTHLDDEALVMRLYGDDDNPSSGAHLDGCPSCRGRLEVWRRDLMTLADDAGVPDPGPDYERRVWLRLADRLESPSRARQMVQWGRTVFSWPRLALAGGMAVLIVGAFLAGRSAIPSAVPAVVMPPTGTPVPTTTDYRERVLLIAVGDHLDRSRVVLAELVHGTGSEPGEGGFDAAADLVATNRLFRQSAIQGGDPSLAGVLEELERVLVEMANATESPANAGVARLRERVETRGLLFKVTVLGSQVRQRQHEAAVQASETRRSAT